MHTQLKRELEKELVKQRLRVSQIAKKGNAQSQSELQSISEANQIAFDLVQEMNRIEERLIRLQSQKPSHKEEECVDGVCKIPTHSPDAIVASDEIDATKTTGSWRTLFIRLAKFGVKAAAPQYALPFAAGVGVLGWMAARVKHRRRSRSSDRLDDLIAPPQMPVQFAPKTETQNHYVVKETDELGEAYKEAFRRIVAAMKGDRPGIVDVVKQIEHTAQEIIRGKRIKARSQAAPRPGIWQEEDDA